MSLEIPKFDPRDIEGSIEMPLEGRIVDTVDRRMLAETDENGQSITDHMNNSYGVGNWQFRNKDPRNFTEGDHASYALGADLIDIVVSEQGDAFAAQNEGR